MFQIDVNNKTQRKKSEQFINCCLCLSSMYITVEYNRKYILAGQTSINDCNAIVALHNTNQNEFVQSLIK